MRTIWLLLIGLAMSLLAAAWVRQPGYMDADYYAVTARELTDGKGFSEPFLWNYIDDPAAIPHPSHLYWMPLPSLLAAGSMRLLGSTFRAAQAPFILITALLPAFTARIAMELTQDRGLAWQAGLLAAFSGFFLPFMVTTDSFALYAIIGGIAFWLMTAAVEKRTTLLWFGLGIATGVGNLARADGQLLLVTGIIAAILTKRSRASALGSLILGYGLIMIPWWARNLTVVGSISNPGSLRLLWMLSYDDLFAFPPTLLSFDRWGRAGVTALAEARATALLWNLARLVAENGMVFLAPFMVLGALRLWSKPLVRLPIYFLGLLLAAMTLVFPFIGPRGAFFHSSVAAMPVLWALAPVGLRAAIDWAGGKRNWDVGQAQRVLSSAALGLAAALTIGLLASRIVIPARVGRGWGAGLQTYAEAGRRLTGESGRVAVNNPPGFSFATHREAVVIPNGPPETLQQVSSKFQVEWILLEANHPAGLDELYTNPESLGWLRLVDSYKDPAGQPVYLLQVIQA